jgi:LysR family hydrogen peroxide-inducible transcriptional activator
VCREIVDLSNSFERYLPSCSAMDLRQLAALTAVADHHSFSAAARALHTVQSNVSTHVARLEHELGTTLVERSSGALSDEGEVVVARARRIQGELEALAADVASLRDEVSGAARLGVIGTTAAHPRVRLVLVDATTTSLLPQLVAARLDLAVVNLPVDDPDLVVQELFEEDRIVVAPTSHPLAAHDRVTLAELAEHRLLLEPPGTAFRDELDAEARRADVALSAQAEVDGMRLLASLAFAGFGAAILPASAAPRSLDGEWRRVEVAGLSRRAVGLVVRRRGLPSAPARAVREVLGEVIERQVPTQPGLHLFA